MSRTTTPPERITLYFRHGASDKVYQASINPSPVKPGLFTVNFAYGRRGSTLTMGSKTPRPVEYPEARRIYDRLVASKTAKGYTPGSDGTPYQGSEREPRATAILPQLLNPIDEHELQRLIADDRWWMQEKFDGRRLLVSKAGHQVMGVNRSGLTTALPEPIARAVRLLPARVCILDGEAVGDVLHAFDLLEHEMADLRMHTYERRYEGLVDLVDGVRSDALRHATTAITTAEKRLMLATLRRRGGEGVVLKRRDSFYAAGRPASGGDQLKFKFYATASCIVAGVNGSKRSVALELLDASGVRVKVGNVTVPPNHAVPAPGTVIEVRYLYAYPSGALYQPVYLRPRHDIDHFACAVAQLKYKPVDDGS